MRTKMYLEKKDEKRKRTRKIRKKVYLEKKYEKRKRTRKI